MKKKNKHQEKDLTKPEAVSHNLTVYPGAGGRAPERQSAGRLPVGVWHHLAGRGPAAGDRKALRRDHRRLIPKNLGGL